MEKLRKLLTALMYLPSITSEVKDGTATLTAEKSTGNYTGYKKDKNTTFVVNVSKEPTKVTAKKRK